MMSPLSRCFCTVSIPLSGACICTLHSWARTRPFPHQPVAATVCLDKENTTGSDIWFVAAEPSCSLLAKAEWHGDTSPGSHSIPEAAAQRQWVSRQPKASANSGSGLSRLWFSVYGGTFAWVIGTRSCIHRGKKRGLSSQSEQENVNMPHSLVNADIMNIETMVTLWR